MGEGPRRRDGERERPREGEMGAAMWFAGLGRKCWRVRSTEYLVLSTEYPVLVTCRAAASIHCLLVCLSLAAPLRAEFPSVPPTPPEKAEATFEVQHGFRMELIAAEPLVVDPVDMAYDENGRAYVVEMRDYPYPEEKNAAPTVFPGTVRLLEDADGDGKFDRSTVFADQLAWPTSVCCYKGGVFVAAAPDIWYFKDTDGDNQADVRRKVFTGFSRYNVQAIMNSLRWGLDNKIYGAAAGNGGTVRHAERPDEPVVQLTRRDFRFDPVTEKIEAIAGGERFGACFDDWGNRFLCNIRNPVQHVVLALHYMQRNPHLIVPSLIHDCAESGDQLRVYRISPPEPWRQFRAQRWSLEGANMPRSELIGAGYWTSSSGVCVYRGGAYPEAFRGNVFIGEVAGNLIHRQILERDGVTFKSRRADENTEFVRSTDNWFRPVNFVNAPDGTLHVLDMYRETIEHPWSIPDDIKFQLDLSSGNDRGRIYRLAPPGYKFSKPPKHGGSSTVELVAHLESPHSWVRETAQRLLFERQDRSAIEPLRKVAFTRPNLSRGLPGNLPQARIHALYTLAGITDVTIDDLKRALDDLGPVADHAIILSEKTLIEQKELLSVKPWKGGKSPVSIRDDIALAVSRHGGLQVALSIGHADPGYAAAELLRIAQRQAGDPWMRIAILSSALPVANRLAGDLLRSGPEQSALRGGYATLIHDLAVTIAAADKDFDANKDFRVQELLHSIARCPDRSRALAALAGLGQGLARQRQNLSDRLEKLGAVWAHFGSDKVYHLQTIDLIKKQLDDAVGQASGSEGDVQVRLQAIRLLGLLPWSRASAPLTTCIASTQPRDVQQVAMRVLGSFNEPGVGGELLSRWKQMTPPLREEVVNVLLSRPIWHEALISAMESGEVPVAQVSIPQRGRLAAIRDEKLAARAKKVLEQFVLGTRKEVVEQYQEALKLAGDTNRGQVVYRRECANCHKLRGEGHEVGPSLETIQHRSPQEILVHVLDPNREVPPNFLEYVVRLGDGRVLTGLIASETDAGLTLKRAQNQEETVPRSEIEEMASSGKSLMPEGVEQKVSPQEMADLIEYLRKSGAN